MIRTRVGYAGGQKENPTYYSLGDHTETLQLDYDPAQITYQELLDIFWHSHNPTHRGWSRQYMSALFYHDDDQKALALKTKTHLELERHSQIFTEILPAARFYLAEDYHQKYMLQKSPELMREFNAVFPNFADLVNSTAAARVNGYLGGYGNWAQLESVLDSLGLPPERSQNLQRLARRFYGGELKR